MTRTNVVQVQIKLYLRPAQERVLIRWLWTLTAVWNWGVKKFGRDAEDGLFYSEFDVKALVNGHGATVGIPAHTIADIAVAARRTWQKCWDGLAGRPRLKGRRNRLSWIPIRARIGRPRGNRIRFAKAIGTVRFRGHIPDGDLRNSAHIVRRASGWYLCLTVAGDPALIPQTAHGEIGIDCGFASLLTLSSGEKIAHPRELEAGAARLSQAQRGRNRNLTARLLERQTARRKDRNHKLSHRLIAENALVVMSADNHRAIRRRFGKSVTSSSHYQLRQMLTYKSRTGGREYIEVSNRNSTKRCSACGALTGPSGLAGLSVRHWTCGCGAEHDRDTNAAVNTLIAGRGMRHESSREAVSERVI